MLFPSWCLNEIYLWQNSERSSGDARSKLSLAAVEHLDASCIGLLSNLIFINWVFEAAAGELSRSQL